MKKILLLSMITLGVLSYSRLTANEPISGCGSGENGQGNWGRCYSGVCKSSINPFKTCAGTTTVEEPEPEPINP